MQCKGVRMSLLRRTKFPHCLTADAPNFDRGHWLRPTVVPADSRPLSWPPIGALPRNCLAYSAAGSASAISPLHPPLAALGSLPTGAARPRNDRFTKCAAQNRRGSAPPASDCEGRPYGDDKGFASSGGRQGLPADRVAAPLTLLCIYGILAKNKRGTHYAA